MRLGTRLRRILVMMIVLLGLLAGLGVASAQEDAPIPSGEGSLQTPRVTGGASPTLPSNPTDTPLSSPSPIQATTPLGPTPGAPPSATGTPDSTDPAPTKSGEKTNDQAVHTVRFDPADGSKPTQASVKTGALATPPQHNPQREGFRFDGWTHDGQPFNFQTPILQDTTLEALWTKTTDWTLNPDHGPASGARLTISPPDRQEPQFASIQAAGSQILGLTGDGRIYTWPQDGTPRQVPAPVQAADGFRYLQAAAGSHWQAALGSDQHIYTWTSQQPTPTILEAGQDPGFTSISLNNDWLLAVDRQGQVHAYQSRDADSRDPNPKLIQQATTSLLGKAQAVTAVSSSRRILIVDADGQAWTWDTSSTGNAKPARVRQKPGTRIVQAQAINQGFLLNENGQAWYLAEGKNSPTAAGLPNSTQISRITSSGDQATIIDKDGHIWAWKPGETPTREDTGNQPYMQATAAGNRITAINRQGSLFAWSLDGQGQPGKPARLDTTQAPTLESASMDSHALTLTKNNDSWQTDMPAHKPGQAAILITGRQDGEPFTRSLGYTVDQTLTRDGQQGTTHTVTFNATRGSPEPADQHFSTPNGRVKRPSPDPAREGFLFDGWFIGEVAYDFSRPVTKDLTLTAKWTTENRNSTWKISPDKGSQAGQESTTITPPDTSRGIRFSQVSGAKNDDSVPLGFSLAVGSDGNAYAWGNNKHGRLGDGTTAGYQFTPVMVKKPTDAPPDFTYVQVSAGGDHSLAVGSDGNAYAWGDNYYNQLGDGTTTTTEYKNTPVKVSKPANTPPDFTYVQVSAGRYQSLAIGSDGNAYGWGDNAYGELGDGTETRRNTPVKVSKPANTPEDFTYVQISTGWHQSLAIGSDGNAYGWGFDGYGGLGDGTAFYERTTPVKVCKPADTPEDFTYVQVSSGYFHGLAVGSDGNAYAWGDNEHGELGNNTSGKNANLVPVRVRDPASPTDKNRGLKAVQVSAGWGYSLALDSNGNAYAWGYNEHGELGNNTSGKNANPVPVRVRDPASPTDKSKGLKAVQVSAGWDHSLAVGNDGNAYGWGRNGYSQLSEGTGNYNPRLAPTFVVVRLVPVITYVEFNRTDVSGLKRGDKGSVTVLTPAHEPGTVTVIVTYKIAAIYQFAYLRYTYTPLGALPQAGGEGILLALATGMTGMGGVLASRRHRRETRQLSQASHE